MSQFQESATWEEESCLGSEAQIESCALWGKVTRVFYHELICKVLIETIYEMASTKRQRYDFNLFKSWTHNENMSIKIQF